MTDVQEGCSLIRSSGRAASTWHLSADILKSAELPYRKTAGQGLSICRVKRFLGISCRSLLADIHERLGSFGLLNRQPSATEVRRAVSMLKKYQILEPLDLLEELEGASRMVIYPSINMLLVGDDARALVDTFRETEEEDGEAEIPGIIENLPE